MSSLPRFEPYLAFKASLQTFAFGALARSGLTSNTLNRSSSSAALLGVGTRAPHFEQSMCSRDVVSVIASLVVPYNFLRLSISAVDLFEL